MLITETVRIRILHAVAFLFGICWARSLFYPEDWPLLHQVHPFWPALAIALELGFRRFGRPLIGGLVLLGMAWGSVRFQNLRTGMSAPSTEVHRAQCLETLNAAKSTYLVRVEGFRAPLRLRLKDGRLEPGELFDVSAHQIKPLVCRGHAPGQFCYARWSMDRGQAFAIYLNKAPPILGRTKLPLLCRFREEVRRRLCRRTSYEVRPWALALVLGDKGQFAEKEIKQVQDFGLMHVLAISGLHIGLFYRCLIWVLRILPLSLSVVRWGQIVLLAVVWGYAALCHMVPSVLRASLFITWTVWGRSFLRCPTDSQSVWPVALLLQLLIRPQDAFDMGFQLSYMATAALFYWVPQQSLKIPGLKALYITMVCALLSFPVLIFANGQFSMGFWVGALCLAPALVLFIPLFWIGLFLPSGIWLFEDFVMQGFLFFWTRIPAPLLHYWRLTSISVYEVWVLQLSFIYFIAWVRKLFSQTKT